MAWVKRGGGTGTGVYGGGLVTAVEDPVPSPVSHRPAAPDCRPAVAPAPRGTAPAYLVADEELARDNRVLLDLLAHNAATGHEAETSMYYPAALQAFGADSPHFTAACQGQVGAGAHYLNGYLNAVAEGRIRPGG